MACLGVIIDLSILGTLSNPLEFNAQTTLTVTGGTPTTGVTAFYTIGSNTTEYPITTGTTVYAHAGEGNVFTYNIVIDDCVYSCTLKPNLNFNPDEGSQVYFYDDASCEPQGIEVIYGCTNPDSPNYNVNANVDDGSCEDPILGCTNPDAENYDPTATVDDGSCVITISGCTDPRFEEYNENATVDDGSCQTLKSTVGCTNPLASNYNPNATTNDGNCIFISGCTNPFADNYNENAVVDDGSCKCDEFNILFNFSGNTGTTLTTLSGQTCDFFVDLDLMIEAECGSIIEYFVSHPDTTILSILNNMKVDFHIHSVEGTGNTLSQVQNLWNFDINQESTGLYLYGSSGDCETLLELLSIELGFDCTKVASNLFKREWRTYRVQISESLNDQLVQLSLNLDGFGFNACSRIDNVNFFRTCENNEEKCVLVPKIFGFNLERAIDNRKSWVDVNQKIRRTDDNTNYIEFEQDLIWNTKEIDLRLNVVKYIDDDIVNYFNSYEQFIENDILKGLTYQRAEKELIDVRNRLTTNKYHFLEDTFGTYQNGLNNCALISKQLNYCYITDVLDKTNTFWFNIIQQLVPDTSIWKGSSHYYANSIFHQNKYKYKTYTIEKGDLTIASLECNFITDDECDRELPYRSRYEQILQTNDLCVTGNSISVGFINDAGFGSGKLVQYFTTGETDNNIIEIINLASGETLGSCSGDTACSTSIIIDDVTTNEPTTDTFETTASFNTTGVSTIDQLSAIVNGVPFAVTTFDVDTQQGTVVFTPIDCENAVSVFADADPCGTDNDTVLFGHCPITNFTNTPATSNPFNPGTFFSSLNFDICCVTNDDPFNIEVTVQGASDTAVYFPRSYVDCSTEVPVTLYNGVNNITIRVQTDACGEVIETFVITI